jgi:hypothetical protein
VDYDEKIQQEDNNEAYEDKNNEDPVRRYQGRSIQLNRQRRTGRSE